MYNNVRFVNHVVSVSAADYIASAMRKGWKIVKDEITGKCLRLIYFTIDGKPDSLPAISAMAERASNNGAWTVFNAATFDDAREEAPEF